MDSQARETYSSPIRSMDPGHGILNFFEIGGSNHQEEPDTATDTRPGQPGVVAPFIPRKSRSMLIDDAGLAPGTSAAPGTVPYSGLPTAGAHALDSAGAHAPGIAPYSGVFASAMAGAHASDAPSGLDVPNTRAGGGLEVSEESARYSIGPSPPPPSLSPSPMPASQS